VPNIQQRPEAPLKHANPEEHRRIIAMRANVGLPIDGTKPMTAPLLLSSYTTATLPDATLWEGGFVYISDEGTAAYSDGTNWRRISNGYVAKTTAYTVTPADYTINCTSGTFTVTMPTAVGLDGQEFIIKSTSSGVITVATTSSQTIDGATTVSLSTYEGVTLVSDGANWIIV